MAEGIFSNAHSYRHQWHSLLYLAKGHADLVIKLQIFQLVDDPLYL